MSSPNFYLDNDDLRFQMERRVNWSEILAARGEIGHEDAPYQDEDEAREIFQEMLQDPVGSLAAERIAPRAADVDAQGCRLDSGEVILPEPMRNNMEDLAKADLMGFCLPREYGGLGFPTTLYTAATEIFSRADASLMNLFGLQGIAETIVRFGTEDQKRRYIPRFASGEITGAMVLTEPDAGSDLMAVQTRAVFDEAEQVWKIRGTKRFITNGCGDVLLVLARSEDPERFAGARGLSLFVVEKSERVQVRRLEEKMGIHGSPTCELYFNDARGELIGRRGRGLTQYVNWLMNAARLGVAAQCLGIMEAAFREAFTYSNEREQFGSKIISFPPVAEMLMDIKATMEGVRTLVYRTSEAVDIFEGLSRALESMDRKDPQYNALREKRDSAGQLADLLTPISKFYASEQCIRITSLALQVHGGSGYMRDYPIERLYRDARITNIYEGTSQMQVERAFSKMIKGAMNGALQEKAHELGTLDGLDSLGERLSEIRGIFQRSLELVLQRQREDGTADQGFRSLMARRVVEMGAEAYISHLLAEEALQWDRKIPIAKYFANEAAARARMHSCAIEHSIGSSVEEIHGFLVQLSH
jgi:hypothetical protein